MRLNKLGPTLSLPQELTELREEEGGGGGPAPSQRMNEVERPPRRTPLARTLILTFVKQRISPTQLDILQNCTSRNDRASKHKNERMIIMRGVECERGGLRVGGTSAVGE